MSKQGTTGLEGDLEHLYLEFLHAFYEAEDLPRSQSVAEQFAVELAKRPDLAESIRGDELRSMISELDGDIETAIKHRQGEIRRILELHSLVQGSPHWGYVFNQYDYRDISDRLDLLAGLYARMGDYKEAINLLNESRRFCASHGIPFDGEDQLEEFTETSQVSSEASRGTRTNLKVLDAQIIHVYKEFNRSSDQILVDESLSRQFAAEVLRRLPADMQVPMKLVKGRLLNLRRRGEDRGGLPRLRRRA